MERGALPEEDTGQRAAGARAPSRTHSCVMLFSVNNPSTLEDPGPEGPPLTSTQDGGGVGGASGVSTSRHPASNLPIPCETSGHSRLRRDVCVFVSVSTSVSLSLCLCPAEAINCPGPAPSAPPSFLAEKFSSAPWSQTWVPSLSSFSTNKVPSAPGTYLLSEAGELGAGKVPSGGRERI